MSAWRTMGASLGVRTRLEASGAPAPRGMKAWALLNAKVINPFPPETGWTLYRVFGYFKMQVQLQIANRD